jgi:two-component system, chemotaxis family, sensor kinase CheA
MNQFARPFFGAMESVRLRHTFLREMEELLEALDQGLLELESPDGATDVVDRLFRAAHTLKGNAGMVGFVDAVQLTHVLENVLDRLRSGAVSNTPDVVGALFLGIDALRIMAGEFRNGLPISATPELKRALAELSAHSTEPADAAIEVERTFEVTFYLRPTPLESAEDLLSLLDEIAMIGEVLHVETMFDRVPALQSELSIQSALGAKVRLRTTSSSMAIMGVLFLSVEEEDLSVVDVSFPATADATTARSGAHSALHVAAPIQQPASAHAPVSSSSPERRASGQRKPRAADSSTLRVDTEKLDGLVDLVGELVIGISQVRVSQQLPGSNAQLAVERLELLGRELQDQVMALRMLPIQETFERFRRPLRDLSKELGKPLEFKIQGGETQVDKRVLDSLGDPLKHMLRNCVSHGLEMPQDRIKAGKPAEGTISVTAAQREGHIVIEIADDGRGIDAARVRAKAEEKGLITKGQEFSEAQVIEFIFLPGFSTAAEVSEISGRGVGLDVVRKNIQALRGSVETSSVLGGGTTFRIRLPLTLAIVDGMNVVVGDETVTIPLRSVVELIDVGNQTVRKLENAHEYIDVRGELVPMLRLGALLELVGPGVRDEDQRIVLVETERRKFGLLVDRVLGMSQTVIKSLDLGYRLVAQADQGFDRPRGISGAAILGDGNVGIIVDVHGIEQLAFEAA